MLTGPMPRMSYLHIPMASSFTSFRSLFKSPSQQTVDTCHLVTEPHKQFSPIQSLSCVRLFATPWTAAHQASLSITNSWSLFKPMSTELVMPSNHPILCHPLLLLPSIFPSIRVFSNELVLRIRWQKYYGASASAPVNI